MTKVIEKRYVCKQCGATDTLKLFEGEKAPLAVNCWKCHSGLNVELGQMYINQVGMFPEVPSKTATQQ